MADTGMVLMHSGSVAPDGWAICDGSPHGSAALEALIGSPNTPDLRDKFIRGAGVTPLGTVGGLASIALGVGSMPAHDHGGATSSDGAHAHLGSATSASKSFSHTHAGTSGNDSVNHTHSSPGGTSGTVSVWHTHPTQVNEGSGDGDGGNYTDTNPTSQSTVRDIGGSNNNSASHYHSSGSVNSNGISANHTHAITAASTSIAHTHSIASGAASAAHTHALSSVGSGTSVPLVPVHYAVVFLIGL